MMGYEEYLRKNPLVSRKRSALIIESWDCYFLKRGRDAVALIPRNSFDDDFVTVYVNKKECTCNVFRSKKGCPHIAAALAKIEQNGGNIPYTDPVSHVHAVVESIRKRAGSSGESVRYYISKYIENLDPFLIGLSKKEKQTVLVELADLFEDKAGVLSDSAFLHLYDEMMGWDDDGSENGKLLFENREKYYRAIVCLLTKNYRCPFTDEQTEQVMKEIAADEALAQRCLPLVRREHYSYFSLQQLLKYYHSLKDKNEAWGLPQMLAKRLLEEEPPRYEEFLEIYNQFSEHFSLVEVDLDTIGKMYQAGFRDQLQGVVRHAVSDIRSVEDYRRFIQVIPHEDFLPAWREERQKRGRYGRTLEEWEMEVSFREDPEETLSRYNLEFFSCEFWGRILSIRPEFREELNQMARKVYRKALKDDHREKMLSAIELLAKGEDKIAIKYASAWELDRKHPEEMVRLAAIGKRFDCVEKVLPGMKKLEVPHAAR